MQPLDVSLNKPFKAFIRGAWEEYMVEQAQQSTGITSSIPTASRTEIVQWIISANECLNSQKDMIQKSFLVCGISNNLDGSENHLVRVPDELPTFEIPYGIDDNDSDDPFQSSDSASGEDTDDSTDGPDDTWSNEDSDDI